PGRGTADVNRRAPTRGESGTAECARFSVGESNTTRAEQQDAGSYEDTQTAAGAGFPGLPDRRAVKAGRAGNGWVFCAGDAGLGALVVAPAEVAFHTEHPVAHLPVVAAVNAADHARRVEARRVIEGEASGE